MSGEEAADYLCYRLRCAKDTLRFDMTDQFGQRVIRIKRAEYLCAPAERLPVM